MDIRITIITTQSLSDSSAMKLHDVHAEPSTTSRRARRIFFSVGEPSGDLHAANLIAALRRCDPNTEFVGYGGPKMAAAGCKLHFDLTALAVMWLVRVIANIHKFLALLMQADRYFRTERPDAVILVDYPGFNWWIAKRAKRHGIPVFYYSPPQIWAWGRWRVKKMRRYVDHVLCGLPFECQWLKEQGCNAVLVGHPFFDEVRRHPMNEPFVAIQRSSDRPLVAILPGSRTQEVQHNLHWFLRAARIVRVHVPNVRFAIACFKAEHAAYAEDAVRTSGVDAEVFVDKTPELISAADCCMAVSGSVSLELLHHKTPTVIMYRIGRMAYAAQRVFRKIRYITLVNLLAADNPLAEGAITDERDAPERQLFPEYLICNDQSGAIARHIIKWVTDETARQSTVLQLETLKARVASPGASQRAAEYIDSKINMGRTDIPSPHISASRGERAEPSVRREAV